MDPRQTSINQSALGWVKKSIDDNLSEINVDLKHYIEDEDATQLESIKERLAVVQGVLTMIEQYGAAMLTEEMVSLCEYIIENKQEQGGQALEVMLRAVLQLPDYLEHIQAGHRDIPIAILPLLNDIRAVKNQDLFSEKLLFLPDLSMHQDGADDDALDSNTNQASRQFAKKLRPVYQLALLKIIKNEEVKENLRRLEKVCETLEEKSFSEQIARIWWIIGALVESVSRQQLELGASIKSLLGKVDALFRVLLLIGEQGLLKRQPIELIKNFLFYIAQPECDGPKTRAIKTAYRLEQFLPSEAARSRVLDNIAGPNQALLKTVGEAMKADIEAVKSKLEVYVNGDLGDTDQLMDIPQDLHIISDTLAMIGLGQQRQMIEEQIGMIKEIVAGNQLSSEEELLSMASELLQVEHALDQMQKRQVAVEADSRSESDVSRDYELDNVLTAIVTAALDDIQKTKSAILEFIKDSTRSENIQLCIELMNQSRGALELLNQPRAVAVVDGLLQYLDEHDIVEFMDVERLDALSQVVVSLEYYLEALGERRNDADSILNFADTQLQALLESAEKRGIVPGEAELMLVDEVNQTDSSIPLAYTEDNSIELIEPDAETTSQPLDNELEMPEDEIVTELSGELEDLHAVLEVAEAEPEEQVPDNFVDTVVDKAEKRPSFPADEEIKVDPVVETLEVLKPGSDPEILDIYIEEAEEESENIVRLQQDWMLHPEDQNALKNIRRAFHTIKGSGRLVGAMKIGEFAWDYEQLLNRVIDKTIAPSDTIIKAVGEAGKAAGELVEELKTSQPPASDIAYLRGLARTLATFDADQVLIERTGIMQVIESPHDHITGASEIESVVSDLDDSPVEETPVEPIPAFDYSLLEEGVAIDAELEIEESIELTSEVSAIDNDLEDNPLPSLNDNVEIEAPVEAVEQEELVAIELDELHLATPPLENDTVSEVEEHPPDPLVEIKGDGMPGEPKGISTTNFQEQDVLTDLSIDQELLTIYQQEVEQHLGIVNTALKAAEQSGEFTPNEDVYRALHTIHGASRTASISSIGELSSLMEKPLKMAFSQSLALDQEVVKLYRQGYLSLLEMTRELVESKRIPVIPEDLQANLIALGEDLEEHTVEMPEDMEQSTSEFIDTLNMMNEPSEEPDNELLAIFIEEANELLEMSDHTLHIWAEQETDKSGSYDYTAVMELQRYLHTLKGGAKMAELLPISDLSHELESMFIAVIDNRVEKNEDLVDLLKDSFDLLHTQIKEAEQHKTLSDSGECVEKLKFLRRHGSSAPVEEEPPVKSQALSDSGETHNAVDSVVEYTDPAPERLVQDVIRVRSDLLDNLVNSAGEVSIYRARMEQQVAGFGSHLGELGQTIMRLKRQLRSLEAETDAQIHFSHQTHAKENDDFDPLEMDRYTMIQELSRSLSESVNDLSSLQNMLGEQVKDSETLLLQQSRVNTDLQDGLIKSRMVKFSGLFSRLRRLVRQTSQELGIKAELVISGEENEVDTKVLDRMIAPLEHIIRNAISHGIEAPVERVKKGKSEIGKIDIAISRDGSDIVIRVSDDGAGVNLDKVRGRALQLGLIEHDQSIADNDLVQYILEPGFSTADHVTQTSGRGVGMDVVDIEIKQLGGTLQIETGSQGTAFVAHLPFTLSINQAILVRTGEETYAIPLINIEGITRLETYKLVEHYKSESTELEFAGQKFTLYYLSHLIGAGTQLNVDDEQFKQPVILIRSGDMRIALHVDELLGNREIVVKALGKQLGQTKGLAGASILADGSVVLILDVNGLVRHSNTGAPQVIYQTDKPNAAASRTHMKSTVMVVDDSITMRRVASKLLERHNYEVVTAKDGVDALAQLEDVQPDVMLLDIEMPRMDGYELASHMQNENQFSKIPIIMITSRTGEKHRDRALEIGVTSYMGKPYQEEELIGNIQRALEG
ncbi:MAG: response regulator [Gammaproteobacteria bacterium]|nr:response regulator [Gammaproteobacteria bacterium]